MRLSLALLRRVRGFQGGVADSAGVVQVDHVAVSAAGGRGGAGLRTHGGVGGTGGDVVLVAHPKTRLIDIQQRLGPAMTVIGGAGRDARKVMIYAPSGHTSKLNVPKGIVVTDSHGRTIGELNKDREELVICRGGLGGGPANNFKPERPPKQTFHLDIKLLADIGFVGYPNAGKSTLLKSLCSNRPAISSFPFTTLKPQIGTLSFPDFRRITVADLPGLIEGAYRNVGQGHRFLKHVERTRLLLILVDVTGFQLNQESPYRTAEETLALLNRELELYDESLLDKPAALVLNKLDLPGSERRADELEALLGDESLAASLPSEMRPTRPIRFHKTFRISALQKSGIDELRAGLRSLLDELDAEHRKLRSNYSLPDSDFRLKLT